jgi:TM2 domain-containing membrane protein YozV
MNNRSMYIVLTSLHIYCAVFMFLYSLKPDQFYNDIYYWNLLSLLMMLLYQLIINPQELDES